MFPIWSISSKFKKIGVFLKIENSYQLGTRVHRRFLAIWQKKQALENTLFYLFIFVLLFFAKKIWQFQEELFSKRPQFL